jgi:hypothetical protein
MDTKQEQHSISEQEYGDSETMNLTSEDRGFSTSTRICDPLHAWERTEGMTHEEIVDLSIEGAQHFPFDGPIEPKNVVIDRPYFMTPSEFVNAWFSMSTERIGHPDSELVLFLALRSRSIVLLPDQMKLERVPSYGTIAFRSALTDPDGEFLEDIYWDQWDGFEYYAPVTDWLWHARKTPEA